MNRSYGPTDAAFPPSTMAQGMDLRTYLAAQALQGLLANPEYWKMMMKDCHHFAPECLAIDAREVADAMINELNKPST